MLDLITFCKKIEPFVIYYKWLIKSYDNTVHNILNNEINLILPQVPRKQKCGIITMLVSSFIGLAYEGISSFLHYKWNKALHKAVRAMEIKAEIQWNKLMELENSMHLQHRNRKIDQHCTQYTQYNILMWKTVCGTTKLSNNQNCICTLLRFTPLFHKFSFIFEDYTG